MPDGSLLDFSGRHLLEGADDKFLRGRRTSDHREIASIEGDVTYTVTTEISGKGEQFTNFFTDKKPTIAEQGTSNTDNQHVQPQMSAHNSSAKLQKVSE